MILLGHDFSYKSNKDKIYSGSSKLQCPLISLSAWEQNKKYYFLIHFFFYIFNRDLYRMQNM